MDEYFVDCSVDEDLEVEEAGFASVQSNVLESYDENGRSAVRHHHNIDRTGSWKVDEHRPHSGVRQVRKLAGATSN